MSVTRDDQADDYKPRATVNSVAMWIFDQVRRRGSLDNAVAVSKIMRLFGSDFIVFDQHTGPRLRRALFNAVRRISRGAVVYDVEGRRFDTPLPVSPDATRMPANRGVALAVCGGADRLSVVAPMIRAVETPRTGLPLATRVDHRLAPRLSRRPHQVRAARPIK